MKSRRTRIIWLWMCQLFLWSIGAVAQESPASVKGHRLVVAVPEASTGVVADELVAALRSQLGELGVEVVLSSRPLESAAAPDPNQQEALAFVWLVRQEETLAVHFFEAAGEALRQRRLPLRGADAASLEEVSLVVRSAVSALLERREEEESVQTTPAVRSVEDVPQPEPAPETPMPQGARFWVGGGWTGQSYAPSLPFSQGAFVEVGVLPRWKGWGLGLNYSFLPPQKSETEALAFEIGRHPVEVIFKADTDEPGRRFFVGIEGGAILDLIRRRTISVSPSLAPASDTTRASWALGARLLSGVRLNRSISLSARGGVDLVLTRVTSTIDAEEEEVILGPHRVRPRAMAVISWALP